MCILPNFQQSDLKEPKQYGKHSSKKVKDENVELLITEQPLENQV